MSVSIGDGTGGEPQGVFDEEKRKKVYRSLRNLINRFLKDEMVDFSLTFDEYAKVTESEFKRLFKRYGKNSEGIIEENGAQVWYEEYVFAVDEKKIGPNEVIFYLKRLEVKYHIEEDGDRRMYVIHSIKGTSDEEGWDIEKEPETHYLFYNDFVYLAVAEDIADEVNKLASKGCITEDQAKAIKDDVYKTLVTISDGFESEAEVARRHMEDLVKSIHDKYVACFGAS